MVSDVRKANQVKVYQKNLKLVDDGGYGINSTIITDDETYVKYYDPPIIINNQNSGCLKISHHKFR